MIGIIIEIFITLVVIFLGLAFVVVMVEEGEAPKLCFIIVLIVVAFRIINMISNDVELKDKEEYDIASFGEIVSSVEYVDEHGNVTQYIMTEIPYVDNFHLKFGTPKYDVDIPIKTRKVILCENYDGVIPYECNSFVLCYDDDDKVVVVAQGKVFKSLQQQLAKNGCTFQIKN